MLNQSRLSLASVALLLTLAGCTDSDKSAKEPVSASSSEHPATPPSGAELKSEAVYFAFDDYTLNSAAQASLSSLAEALKANATAAVQIEGHCDERGSIEYNLALGARRAESVKQYLSQLGVDGARLSTISYGEEKPAVEGHSEEAWAKNRRAEFAITRN